MVTKIRWDSIFIFHMRCHDGGSSFTSLLHSIAYSASVNDAAQGGACWEWEAWEISEGHRAFLDSALHLRTIKAWTHMSMISSKESCMGGGWNVCHWISAGCTSSPIFCIHADYKCKSCFLPPKHITSNMRSTSTFSTLAAFQQWLFLTYRELQCAQSMLFVLPAPHYHFSAFWLRSTVCSSLIFHLPPYFFQLSMLNILYKNLSLQGAFKYFEKQVNKYLYY